MKEKFFLGRGVMAQNLALRIKAKIQKQGRGVPSLGSLKRWLMVRDRKHLGHSIEIKDSETLNQL
ncbi:MAG: hypothetical protein HC913_07455 [Microscillaceae bacterium]|nr:hypothetical protein [Microscillaceae bacterium]